MRVHQVVSGVVAVTVIGLAWIIPQRGIADQPGVSACPADIVGNGVIDAADLVEVVLSLGPCRDCPAELTGDGVVDAADVMAVLAALGGCASTGDPRSRSPAARCSSGGNSDSGGGGDGSIFSTLTETGLFRLPANGSAKATRLTRPKVISGSIGNLIAFYPRWRE